MTHNDNLIKENIHMKTLSLTLDMVYKGNLILVNRDYPYREYTKTNLAPIQVSDGPILMQRKSATIYTSLMNKISAWNHITAVSGWRSKIEQEQIYTGSIAENGEDFTTKYVALPGHSEHQTGLAVDVALAQGEIDFIRPHFPYTGICGDFRQAAGRHGFIERYPKGKEKITGIAHEPWHFRYVGTPHANLIEVMGITLEEYHQKLKEHPHGDKPLIHEMGSMTYEISYLPAHKDEALLIIPNGMSHTVSGNNSDGFIVTLWRDINWNANLNMAG